MFHVKDTAKVPMERMEETLYPFEVKCGYFFYRFDKEENIGEISIVSLLKDLQERTDKAWDKAEREFKKFSKHEQMIKEQPEYIEQESTPFGKPLLISAKELIKYRKQSIIII